jgi:hypothetical protein
MRKTPKATFTSTSEDFPHLKLTLLDNWEELLDPLGTSSTIIIRARKNWLARTSTNNYLPARIGSHD